MLHLTNVKYIVLETKWLLILSLPPNDHICTIRLSSICMELKSAFDIKELICRIFHLIADLVIRWQSLIFQHNIFHICMVRVSSICMELKSAFNIKELICKIFHLANMKYIVLKTKWLRILSLPPNDKIRNHLVAKPTLPDSSCAVKEDLLIGSIKMKFLLYFQRVYIEIFLNLNHYRGCSL